MLTRMALNFRLVSRVSNRPEAIADQQDRHIQQSIGRFLHLRPVGLLHFPSQVHRDAVRAIGRPIRNG